MVVHRKENDLLIHADLSRVSLLTNLSDVYDADLRCPKIISITTISIL